jgi:hypothetical protein
LAQSQVLQQRGRLWLDPLSGREVRPSEMADRLRAEIVVGHLDGRVGVAQAFDDRRAELTADRARAQYAGIDMQKFHGSRPLIYNCDRH